MSEGNLQGHGPRAEERLPWHKPEVQHMIISMATADFLKEGSEEDFEKETTIPGHPVTAD
jgi:hypothetical protein